MARDIIERLEKLREGDREVDALIWCELDGRDVRWGESCFGDVSLLAKSRVPPHDECVVGVRKDDSFLTVGQDDKPSYYTSSIDAALTLVPENHFWTINGEEVIPDGLVIEPSAAVTFFVDDFQFTIGMNHTSPAIALCIAALKARKGV